MSQLSMLKQGVLWDNNRLAVKQKAKESTQRMKDILSTIITTGLTIGTGGAGLPALLSKIPGVANVMKAGGTLSKVAKFLDATQKTTRAGVYGTNILNKLIHRGIGDLIIPDTVKDYDKKAQGYLGDIGTETSSWAKSFLPEATHPWQSEKWEDVIPGDSSSPIPTGSPVPPGTTDVNGDGIINVLDIMAGRQQNVPTPDPRQTIDVSGGTFATTPNINQGLLGNITQKPSGYTGGNPYYNLINMIKD